MLDLLEYGAWVVLGGLGKTTLARAVYYEIFPQFESCCFLPNIREQLQRCTLFHLQAQLFSALIEKQCLTSSTLDLRPSFLKDRLCWKKVLIVVDDAHDFRQLEELLVPSECEPDLFVPGSRFIVTSRNKQVLINIAGDKICTMEELNEHEALQPFSMRAFKKDCPSDCILQAKRVVNYAKGNPLALRVLGSALLDRNDEDWKSMLERLGDIPHPEIHDVLKTSYDGLSSEEKRIFLHIACYFRGKSSKHVTKILDVAFGTSVQFVITTLIDKSLIMVTYNNELEMHDLLQEMGRKVADDEIPTRLLINFKHFNGALMQNKENGEIEGISLDMSMVLSEVYLEPDVFTNMYNLRFLEFYWPYEDFHEYGEEQLHLSSQRLRSLPRNLRYFHWTKFPLKSIPSKFFPESLVVLQMRNSKVKKLWDGVQNLVNLIEIDISDSKYLTEIPDLSKAIKIETIILRGCGRLLKVHSSIQYLHKLEVFNLEGCKKLENLPRRIESKALKVLNMFGCLRVERCPEITEVNMDKLSLDCAAMTQVPKSMLLLSTVSVLNVTYCRKLSSLPRNFCKLKSIHSFSAWKKSEVESLPEILEPMNLVELSLWGCINLRRLPDSIYNVKSLLFLDLNQLGIRESTPSIEHLSCLDTLLLRDCRYLERLPSCIQKLLHLRDLDMRRCRSLHSLPELPPSLEDLHADNCISLQTVTSNFTKYCNLSRANFSNCSSLDQKPLEAELLFITENRHCEVVYPGSEVPGWFTHRSMESSITIQFPLNWDQFKGVVFCIIFEFRKEFYKFGTPYKIGFKMDRFDLDNSGEVREGLWSYPCPVLSDSDHMLIVYQRDNPFKEYSATLSSFQLYPYAYTYMKWKDGCNVKAEILKHWTVKRCGILLVQVQDDTESIISQTLSSSTSHPVIIAPLGSAADTAGILRRGVGSSAATAPTASFSRISLYTNDAPGLKSLLL